MSERVVDTPANHGWVDAGGGKWTWAGTGTDGGPAVWDEIIDKPDEFPPSEHNHDADYAAIDHDHEGVYQPVGNYIEGDAPSDGELYVRKDGAWELYTPSSGGGGYMEPIGQPGTFGDFSKGARPGTWTIQNQTGTLTGTVPAGFHFVLCNIASPSGVKYGSLRLDGDQLYPSYATDSWHDAKFLWREDYHFSKSQYIVRESLSLENGSSSGLITIVGFFIAADGTRESAELREAYMVEDAKRVAAMPPPEPEVGTQEIAE